MCHGRHRGPCTAVVVVVVVAAVAVAAVVVAVVIAVAVVTTSRLVMEASDVVAQTECHIKATIGGAAQVSSTTTKEDLIDAVVALDANDTIARW